MTPCAMRMPAASSSERRVPRSHPALCAFAGSIVPASWLEVERLLGCDNGVTILGIGAAIGQMAAASVVPGWLIDATWQPVTAAALARVTRVSESTMASALETLCAFGVLELKRKDVNLLTCATFIRASCV